LQTAKPGYVTLLTPTTVVLETPQAEGSFTLDAVPRGAATTHRTLCVNEPFAYAIFTALQNSSFATRPLHS